MGQFLVKQSAKAKLKKLRSYESLFSWDSEPVATGGDKKEYQRAASLMVVPQFRGYISIIEKLAKDTKFKENEFCLLNSFTFINAIMGWNLGGGWEFNRECFRKAFVEICGLDPGDVYLVMMEPAQFFHPYKLAYRVMDMTKGPLNAEVFAEVPYEELVGTHPLEVNIAPERIASGMSIAGSFLDTYFICEFLLCIFR